MMVPVTAAIYHAVIARFGGAPTVTAEVPRDHGALAICPYLRATGEFLGVQLVLHGGGCEYLIESAQLTYQETLDASRLLSAELFKTATGGHSEPLSEGEGRTRPDAPTAPKVRAAALDPVRAAFTRILDGAQVCWCCTPDEGWEIKAAP